MLVGYDRIDEWLGLPMNPMPNAPAEAADASRSRPLEAPAGAADPRCDPPLGGNAARLTDPKSRCQAPERGRLFRRRQRLWASLRLLER